MHYYEKLSDGTIEPRHFVEMTTKQGTRPTRITDVKKAAKEGRIWHPSVTTVLNVLDKPALLNWKIEQYLEWAYRKKDEPLLLSEWISLVKSSTQEAMDIAPKAGTDIHKILEDFIGKGIFPENEIERRICDNVAEAINKHTGIHLSRWRCEQYFVDDEHGFAGCADLVCDSKENWVMDFKSKQTADKFKPGKMAYPEHYRQLGAYGRAFFGHNAFRAANIFVCLEDGEVDFHEHSQADLLKGWMDFQDCLSIYKRNN